MHVEAAAYMGVKAEAEVVECSQDKGRRNGPMNETKIKAPFI